MRPLVWPEGSDALLVLATSARDPDLAPFVGPVHLGESLLVWPRGKEPLLGYLTPMERDEAAATGCRLLDPERLGVRRLLEGSQGEGGFLAALAEAALELAGVAPGAVALAGRWPAGELVEACERLRAAGWHFVSGASAVKALRKTKSAPELADARAAAAATVEAFRRVAALLGAAYADEKRPLRLGGERLTAGRLRAEIATVFARRGLDQPQGNIVAAGAAAAVPHTQGDSAEQLDAGEPIVIDLFPRRHLFADCTRTFCVGTPAPALEAAHAEVAAALSDAHRRVRPGVTGWELHEGVCERFAAAGYATPISRPGTESGYVHGLGHGVGFELHELPSFRRDAGGGGVLAAGDLFTLEPGLYDPDDGWGVRLEDLSILGEDGPENLTPLPYELDPRAWPDPEEEIPQ